MNTNTVLLLGLAGAGLYLMRRRMNTAAPAPTPDGRYAAVPRPGRPYDDGRPYRGGFYRGPGRPTRPHATDLLWRWDDRPGYAQTMEIRPWRDRDPWMHGPSPRHAMSWYTNDMPPINPGDPR